MATPTKAVRIRRLIAHNGATQPVPATLYDDDMNGPNSLDQAIANDNTEIAIDSVNPTRATLSVTGKTWQNISGEAQWA